MNTPKIKAVLPLPNKQLLVTFINGIQKIYNCQAILQLEQFQLLQNETFFKTVIVDPGGYGISWNDDLDLSEYELWHNGRELTPAEYTELTYSNPSSIRGEKEISG
jgi:hypothetical protein